MKEQILERIAQLEKQREKFLNDSQWYEVRLLEDELKALKKLVGAL